jgi:phosphopantothenoylcysteine decarboxylase/phosphopantothenate--cysteine ligase
VSHSSFEGKNIVVGVTGGIAAYKVCQLVSNLKKQGAGVDVVMTQNATRFVAPLTFQTLSSRPVVLNAFDPPEYWEVEHVALAKKADLMIVAPATANIIAKMANGIADDMLSTVLLATRAPILIAPAMNTGMWDNPATRENIATLQKRGDHFVGPEGGLLACGDTGKGRMSEPEDILEKARQLLTVQDMQGVKVLVTAGAAREEIDPVRYMTNHSTGKMGYAIAQAAYLRGAEVTLVSGVTALAKPPVRVETFGGTHSLLALMEELAPQNDIVIQAAAPADFTVEEKSREKIKKEGKDSLTLRLVATPDVAKTIGQNKRSNQVFVGFAAETGEGMTSAQGKLLKKNFDFIMLNDVTQAGAGFGTDTNIVTYIDGQTQEHWPLASKEDIADQILTRAIDQLKK